MPLAISKVVNIRGDLFATTFSFVMQAFVRLASSLILTRVLLPEAYGTITILVSVLYVIGNLVDTNVTLFIVRDKNAEEHRYINTAWTIRFSRSVLSAAALYLAAPWIATRVYDLPALTLPLRVFSLWFLVDGFETMAFALAVRRKQARRQVYCELFASTVSTLFSIVYCYHYHTFWGIAFSMILNRLIMTIMSWQFYTDLRPKFGFDRSSAKEILGYSKFTVPSSLLALGLSQFDKMVFLRLFDLRLLGLYSLAGNISGSIESVISKISQSVLYPRCAQNFRDDPATATRRYYLENTKLFAGILALPAALCGGAHFLITVLYDPRYREAGLVLQAFGVRAVLLSFACSAEDLLISAGEFHIILVGNVLRASWIVLGSLLGYYLFGFPGFIYGLALSGLPPLAYYFWLQKSKGMLIARYELYKVAFAFVVGIAAYVGCSLFLAIFPGFRLKG